MPRPRLATASYALGDRNSRAVLLTANYLTAEILPMSGWQVRGRVRSSRLGL